MGFFLGAFIWPYTLRVLEVRREISREIPEAGSIRIEQYRSSFENGFMGEQIFAVKNLDPKDFHKVLDAFPAGLDVGFPLAETMCVFNPHHRIIIEQGGFVTTIHVCFECDHYDMTFDGAKFGEIKGTPIIWMRSLRRFFADEGMPDSPELYHSAPVPQNK